MHLVFRTYADALVTITITEDEAGTTRAPPEGIPQTEPPSRVEEAFREPVSPLDYEHVAGFAKEQTR